MILGLFEIFNLFPNWLIISRFFIDNLSHIVKAFAALFCGLWAIKKTSKLVVVFLNKYINDSGLVSFLEVVIKFILRVLLFIIFLTFFNINIFSIIATLSASIVTLSLILRESLSNLASGLMIIIGKPIHVGDYVEVNSFKGTVVRIDVTFTILLNDEGKTIIVPNSKLISDIIKRKSQWDIIPIEFRYKLSNSKKIKSLENNLERYIVMSKNKVLATPRFEIKYSSDNEETKLVINIWAFRVNISEVKNSMSSFINSNFKKNGIKILKENIIIIL
ncbi:MAG: mechanosensitive ion channel [Candidatus Improbicoccus pseudotrichonymphae]|uniref:Mechanosensitive ion channel n=1 Tax=Candidatus Improbicoccus pseudotrichonymphae TaxID=3033792 RepID=A0AA48KVE2_9FIRM|nr:MAG: mechanosensitive ion channel [Candidatus Improbicoccus pseudotrichonymphae]